MGALSGDRLRAVSATIPVGLEPFGVAVTPDGSKVYVTNSTPNPVSVICDSACQFEVHHRGALV
jgi:DNA-binding beta-propeller fold protein YncE